MLRVWFSEKAERRFQGLGEWRKRIEDKSRTLLKAKDEDRNDHIGALRRETQSSLFVIELGSVRVDFDSSTGRFYLDVGEQTVPLLHEIPGDCVALVTLKESIQARSAFVRQGVYHGDDPALEAVITTKEDIRYGGGLDSDPVVARWQEISVGGPSIEAVKGLYRQIRNRKVEPAGPWDDEKPNSERIPASPKVPQVAAS